MWKKQTRSTCVSMVHISAKVFRTSGSERIGKKIIVNSKRGTKRLEAAAQTAWLFKNSMPEKGSKLITTYRMLFPNLWARSRILHIRHYPRRTPKRCLDAYLRHFWMSSRPSSNSTV